MANTTNTKTLPTVDPSSDRPNPRRRRATAGVVVFALGAGLGWLGGAVGADPTVAVVPEAVSSPRSADALERSALPAAVSSSRSPDALERSALPAAVSSSRSPDAVERSALPDAPAAVSSSRSPDAIERSTSSEARSTPRSPDAVERSAIG